MKAIIAVAVCLLSSVALSSPVDKLGDKMTLVDQQHQPQSPTSTTTTMADRAKLEEDLLRKLNLQCSKNDLNSCVMLKLVTYMNKLLKKASIELTDDIEIRKTSQATEEVVSFQSSSGRSSGGGIFGGGDEESAVFDLIASKVYAFVKSRSIKWKFLPEDDVVVSAKEDETGSLNLGLSIERSENAVQDGRGKKNNMGPLLAAAVLKIGLIGGLAFKGLALLVGKALLLSKIALLLAGIIGLKKLFSNQKHVTYEVVAHPHHSASHTIETHGHGDYSGGWARSFHERQEIAQPMAYSAHAPQ